MDELGLARTDRTLLRTMIEKFGGGPVGLDTLAASTGEDATHHRGRVRAVLSCSWASSCARRAAAWPRPAAYEHLGLTPPRAQGGRRAR